MLTMQAWVIAAMVVWLGLAGMQFAGAEKWGVAETLSETHSAAALSVLTVMWLAGDDEMSDNARYGFDALATSTLVCAGLKRVACQPRPDDSRATCGFPSGHTTSAFTFARTLSHQYPNATPYVYAYAAGTAWSRVELGRHDWPQVVAGALLGTWLANESLHCDGGLLFGWIAPDYRPGMGPTATVSVDW